MSGAVQRSGTWVDAETGELLDDLPPATDPDVLADARMLRTWATGLRAYPPSPKRTDCAQRVARLHPTVAGHRDRLLGLLHRGWDWLERNEDAPDAREREARFFGWIIEYEACEGALNAAEAWS